MEAVEEGKIEGFDRRATIRDPKTGKTIKEQNYTTRISQDGSEVLTRNGKRYWANGQEIVEPKAPEQEPKPVPVVEPTIAAPPLVMEKKSEKPEVSFSKK